MKAAPDQIAALNELFQAESASLLARLHESAPFVAPYSTALWAVVQPMTAQVIADQARLAETIVRLGGSVAPRLPATWTGDLHYLELSRVLPRLIEDERRLAGVCRALAARVAGNRAAADAVHRVLLRHEDNLKRLGPFAEPPPHSANSPAPQPAQA